MFAVGADGEGEERRSGFETFFGDFRGGVDVLGMRDFLKGDAFLDVVVFFDCFCLSFFGDRRMLTFMSISEIAFEL